MHKMLIYTSQPLAGLLEQTEFFVFMVLAHTVRTALDNQWPQRRCQYVQRTTATAGD